MNAFAHRLSLFSAICHLTIGLPELLRIGPRFSPPAWQMVATLLPEWLWWLYPGLFALTGIVAAVGTQNVRALRFGFTLSSCCFLIWALGGVWSYLNSAGSTFAGIAANFYISGAAWVLAHYVVLGRRVETETEVLSAVVKETRAAREELLGGSLAAQ